MLRSRWMYPARMPLEARESAKARSAWAPEGWARRRGIRFLGGRISGDPTAMSEVGKVRRNPGPDMRHEPRPLHGAGGVRRRPSS
jgi:hypothetical protein